jgi:hypothetical protein
VRGGLSVTQQALEAQTALLPYALAAFGVSLPIYVWAGSHAPNAVWMTGSFAIFAAAWGAFYAAVNWLKGPEAADTRRRARMHILCGLIWAGAIAQIAAFADGAGPAREALLLTALAAAIVCMFFTASWLPSLLIVGPAAVAAPLVFLFARPETHDVALLAWASVALALALSLILNRVLRRQFFLAAEREILIASATRSATGSPVSSTFSPPPSGATGGPRPRGNSSPPPSTPPTTSSRCSTPRWIPRRPRPAACTSTCARSIRWRSSGTWCC